MLKAFGQEIIKAYNLKRDIFTFDFELNELSIISFLKTKLEFSEYEIVKREITEDIKFHIDNCKVIKGKPKYNLERYVHIEGNKYLYSERFPRYTAIFYYNNFNVEGGYLIFSDDFKILPINNTGIIFDSREPHMVSKVKKGIRNSLVVKIF